ncbi:PREDICTED: G-box-binding factor 1-like [Populus euphratica]|uniref:G-box-binding factor 1-like n=1 Tax=Populus euphratica TaxID=75702 RepID=A0AAJ6WZ92_POPEU|nr:PREDICTED: G-box-binding factor 1-like [Populus euphratica]
MGTREESTPSKPSKPASSNQEIPATPSYPDWSNSMQADYGAGATPPPFFASTVASPTPHPYIWGSQHPLIPPYGTPVPYPALYPAGGVYAHPNMAPTPNSAPANTELEGKVPDGKDRTSAKKAKGTSGGKAGESEKAISDSGNDGASQSAESDTDGSSDASDENTNQQENAANKKGSFNQMLADANAQSTSARSNIQTSVPGKPVVSMPATNLNIGMDLWNASPAASGATKMRPNPSGASSGVVPAGMPEQWIQDERELKRQKRKQSNRESARRSRLRKQAECEELQVRVENLSNDNCNLRDELQSLSEECNKLKSENDFIKEELTRLYGPEAVANLEQTNPISDPKSHGGEGDS